MFLNCRRVVLALHFLESCADDQHPMARSFQSKWPEAREPCVRIWGIDAERLTLVVHSAVVLVDCRPLPAERVLLPLVSIK